MRKASGVARFYLPLQLHQLLQTVHALVEIGFHGRQSRVSVCDCRPMRLDFNAQKPLAALYFDYAAEI